MLETVNEHDAFQVCQLPTYTEFGFHLTLGRALAAVSRQVAILLSGLGSRLTSSLRHERGWSEAWSGLGNLELRIAGDCAHGGCNSAMIVQDCAGVV